MDFDLDVFVKKLEERLNSVLFNGEHLSQVATVFNQGAMTMHNLALVAAYETSIEMQERRENA